VVAEAHRRCYNDRVRGLIVYNPAAGPRDVQRELKRVARELAQRGWSVDLETTHHGGEATGLARQAAAARLDAVWVAGGDGTVGEVVNGLVGSQTAVGVLPVGTGNIWARQLCLPVYTVTHPFHLREAAVAQAEGSASPIDVGLLNGRHFLLWAGIGFDAQIASELEPRDRRTKRLGALPYAIAAVTLAREFSGVRTRVMLDGRAIRGRSILTLVSNVQMYAFFPLARRARLDDGLLDVFVFKGLGLSYILRHAIMIFSGRHLQDPRVIQRQAAEITVRTEPRVPVQADGDPVGTTPVRLRVVPGALRILVPPQAPASLFSRGKS
jgi:diacylglycerol kinase (ATP)